LTPGAPEGSSVRPPRLIVAPGRGHGGDAGRIRSLIRAAAEAGVGALQLPLYRTDHLISTVHAPELARDFRRTELDRSTWVDLESTAKKAGTGLIPRVFDPELLGWALDRDPPAVALHDGDVTYRRLLEAAAGSRVPLLLGIEGASHEEILRALGWLGEAAPRCVPVGPSPAGIPGPPPGLRLTGEPPRRSASAGGGSPVLVECRFTGDPPSTEELRARLRTARALLEDTNGIPENPSARETGEGPPAPPRRSLMAERSLAAGTILQADMVRELRPGNGIPAHRVGDCLGLRLARPVDPGEILSFG